MTERSQGKMQSASRQFRGSVSSPIDLLKYEAPAFKWIRGQRCTIRVEPPLSDKFGRLGPIPVPPAPLPVELYTDADLAGYILNREHFVVVCEGEGHEYEPLKDAPDAYVRFAAVALPHSDDDELREHVIWFVERYGLPRSPDPFLKLGSLGLPLDFLLWDVAGVYVAVKNLAAAAAAERKGDYSHLRALFPEDERPRVMEPLGPDGTLLTYAKHRLVALLWMHLGGVRLAPTLDFAGLLGARLRNRRRASVKPAPVPIRILPQYTCDDLLSAIWLQVYFSATERKIVRHHCKGCQRPFEANDPRQEYCDPSCRHAANQRSYYRRNKERC